VGHVASLLEEVHRRVLTTVRHDVGCDTGRKERRDVLLALVRTYTGRPQELNKIIYAVYYYLQTVDSISVHHYKM
jgi:hypothetical protein